MASGERTAPRDSAAAVRHGRSLAPSDAGRLLAFTATVTLAVAAPEWRVLEALALAALLAALLSPQALRRAVCDRVWPTLCVFAVLLGAFAGEPDVRVLGVSLSSWGLSLGLQMVARALAILLAVHTLTTRLSLSVLASLFERLGCKGLGFALGVAVNSLPMVQRNAADVLTALRLRGGFRRQPLRVARLFLLTTIVNAVREAEDIVAAAEARGFRPESARSVGLSWQSGDTLLAVAMLASGSAILFR